MTELSVRTQLVAEIGDEKGVRDAQKSSGCVRRVRSKINKEVDSGVRGLNIKV